MNTALQDKMQNFLPFFIVGLSRVKKTCENFQLLTMKA